MKVPLTVLFQVACPHCERDYLLELDVVKLARLKRVAVCGQCGNQFSVSVRTQKREAQRAPAGEQAALAVGEQSALSLAHEEVRRQQLGNQQTEPIIRSPVLARGGRAEIREPASPRPDVDNMATEPDFPFSVEEARGRDRRVATEPDGDAPRRRSGSGQQRTLEGVGARPARRGAAPVDTHIIVEVGTMETGTAKPKKHLKTYRPHNLVTKPGLGIPFQLRAGGAGEAFSRAED